MLVHVPGYMASKHVSDSVNVCKHVLDDKGNMTAMVEIFVDSKYTVPTFNPCTKCVGRENAYSVYNHVFHNARANTLFQSDRQRYLSMQTTHFNP